MPSRKNVATAPATDASGKRFALNMRTTRDLREALEHAAAASGRSLAQEVEARLERGFWEEAAFGGPETARILRKLAGYIEDAERVHNRKLLDRTDAEADLRLDAYIRWLLGEIIGFERAVKRRNSDCEVEQMLADNEANRDVHD